jgi:hypothetical protein
MRRALSFLALTAAWALGGCTPLTQYRYSASVPAVRAIPFDGRTPTAGSLGFEGTLTHTAIVPNDLPQIHDTAVWVPEWTAEGAAFIAVSSHVQLGLRGAYSPYEWSRASATGTMPVPHAPASWGLGPEVRLSFPLDPAKRFALGIAGNAMSYSVPYAEWTLNTAGTTGGQPGCTQTSACSATYSLHDTSSETHWVYSLGLYPSVAVGDRGQYGDAFALLGVTNGFKNDGFTDQASQGSTVDSVGPIVLVGGGYGIRHDVLHANVLLYWPVTGAGSAVEYGLGGQITVGFDFDVVGREEGPPPPATYAPAPRYAPPPPQQPYPPPPPSYGGD